MIKEIIENINEKMDNKTFVDAMVDLADEINIDYNKKSTKDIIGDLVTHARKNKKKLYNFWSKNRDQKLYDELAKAFD